MFSLLAEAFFFWFILKLASGNNPRAYCKDFVPFKFVESSTNTCIQLFFVQLLLKMLSFIFSAFNHQLTRVFFQMLSFLCRLYAGSIYELWNAFMPTYFLFWSKDIFQSDLVLVFDEESEADHMVASVLANLPPYPKIAFELHPPPKILKPVGGRGEGYARQQYSNFYSDIYTDAEYIGIIDSDIIFISTVVPSDLFDFIASPDNSTQEIKPRIFGFNGNKKPNFFF